jgi:hypothetical protein
MRPPHDLYTLSATLRLACSKFFVFPSISYMYMYRRLELHATPFTFSEIHTEGFR